MLITEINCKKTAQNYGSGKKCEQIFLAKIIQVLLVQWFLQCNQRMIMQKDNITNEKMINFTNSREKHKTFNIFTTLDIKVW